MDAPTFQIPAQFLEEKQATSCYFPDYLGSITDYLKRKFTSAMLDEASSTCSGGSSSCSNMTQIANQV